MDTTPAANGEHTTHGTPRGFTSLTPFHTVRDARGAIAWYERVFGARAVDVTEMPDGDGGTIIGHATLDFGTGRLPGLLVMGSEDPHQFTPQQGTDLLAFFAGVFERAMRRWLS